MNRKRFLRTALPLLIVTSLLTVSMVTNSPPAVAASKPSCGDQPNTNRGVSLSNGVGLTGEQAGNARLIMGIAAKRRLPKRAAEVAIIASLQSASLRNTHRNSRGLFQQSRRYYPGVEVTNPVSSTNAFYDRLRTVPNWRNKSRGQAAKSVHQSKNLRTFTKWDSTSRALTKKWWKNSNNPTSCPVKAINKSSRSSNPKTVTPKTTTRRRANLPPIRQTSNRNLVRVGGITVAKSLGPNLQALLAAASADGLRLTGSGWRDPKRQIALRKQNCGTSNYETYRKSPSLCSPPTARPGTSNHERGLAVDFRNCSTRRTACYKWLNRNARRFGLRNLPSEPWHWSTNGR